MELQLEFFKSSDAIEYLVMFSSDWSIAESAQSTATSSFKFPKTYQNIQCLKSIDLESLIYIAPEFLKGSPLESTGFCQRLTNIVETEDDFTIKTESMTWMNDLTLYCKRAPETLQDSTTAYAMAKDLIDSNTVTFKEKMNSPAWWGEMFSLSTGSVSYISKDLYPFTKGSYYSFNELIERCNNLEAKGVVYYFKPTITRSSGKMNTITLASTLLIGKNGQDILIDLDDDFISDQSITLSKNEKVNKVILHADKDNQYYQQDYTLDLSDGSPVVLQEETYTDSDVNDSEGTETAEEYLKKKAYEIINSETEDDAQLSLTFSKNILKMSEFRFYTKTTFRWHGTMTIDSKYMGFSASNSFDSVKMTFGYKEISFTSKMKAQENQLGKLMRTQNNIVKKGG